MIARHGSTSSSKNVIVQFAKWPELGKVKTRMQPHLSTGQSLALHKRLLSHCCNTLFDPTRWDHQLWLAGSEAYWSKSDPQTVLSSLDIETSPEIRSQCAGDLGDKMSYAARQSLMRYQNVVIIGSDCPFISESYINQAFTRLEEGERHCYWPSE